MRRALRSQASIAPGDDPIDQSLKPDQTLNPAMEKKQVVEKHPNAQPINEPDERIIPPHAPRLVFAQGDGASSRHGCKVGDEKTDHQTKAKEAVARIASSIRPSNSSNA